MKRCFCYLLTLVLGSLAVGGLVFALLRTDVLTLTAATPTALFFFAATAAAGLGGLLAYLLGGLLADRTPALADAWLCCGEASAVGALGALLTALITALSTASGVGLHIGAALCCAFLALMARQASSAFCGGMSPPASPVAAARAADRKAPACFARRAVLLRRLPCIPPVGAESSCGHAIQSSYASSTAGRFLASRPAGECVPPVR